MRVRMIEVRIPTFRRPEFLRRALDSLLAQDAVEWRAVVLDDDPEGSARAVVEAHPAHSRVSYRENPVRLGITGNISAAFQPEAFFEGAGFACVLEDDNRFLPELLARNIAKLEESGRDVLLRNAMVHDFVNGEDKGPIGDSLGPTLGRRRREVPYTERLLRSFYQTPMSNLGLCWRLGVGLNLSVAEEGHNSLTAEKMRGLLLRGDLLYLSEPLAIHTHFRGRAYGTEKTARDNRLFRLGEMRFDRLLWARFSQNERAEVRAEMRLLGREAELSSRLIQAGFFAEVLQQRGRGLGQMLRAFLLRTCYGRKLEPLPLLLKV